MSEPPLVDPDVIANLRLLNTEGTDDFLSEIVGLFLTDMPLRLRELDDGLAQRDAVKFKRAAHSIKGSASNLGAEGLRARAEKLELGMQQAAWDEAPAQVAGLKAEFARTQVALEGILKKD